MVLMCPNWYKNLRKYKSNSTYLNIVEQVRTSRWQQTWNETKRWGKVIRIENAFKVWIGNSHKLLCKNPSGYVDLVCNGQTFEKHLMQSGGLVIVHVVQKCYNIKFRNRTICLHTKLKFEELPWINMVAIGHSNLVTNNT